MTCDKCNGAGTHQIAHAISRCVRCLGTGTPIIGAAYAGIGSRETPVVVAQQMSALAMQLAVKGYVLRSGAAKRKVDAAPDTESADIAFERGCTMVGGRKIIRIATHHEPAMQHAAQFHPAWDACSEHAKALHTRNSLIMLGDWLDDPVRFVACWTAGAAVKGGTGQALRIAAALGIPVFNLATAGEYERLTAAIAAGAV